MFHENESNGNGPAAESPSLGRPVRSSAKSDPKDTTHTCSYCGQSFQRSESKHMPFCSRRCQQIDLGMWLNESYGLPHEGEGAPDYDPDSDL